MSRITTYICDRCKRTSNSEYELFQDGLTSEGVNLTKVISYSYNMELCWSCINQINNNIKSYLKGE